MPQPRWKNDTSAKQSAPERRFCVLVVDMQKGFMSEHTAGLPQRIAQFLEQSGMPALFTRFTNPGVGGPFHEFMGWEGAGGPPETDIVDNVVSARQALGML